MSLNNSFDILHSSVVDPGYCVGCGVCVSQCGHGTIGMLENSFGQYDARYIDESSCISCGLCVAVCPFQNDNKNESEIGARKFESLDSISHSEELGYWLGTYVGYADEKTRLNGASGGSVSHVLKWLLEHDTIDSAVVVEPTGKSGSLFSFTTVSTSEEIDRCAKSAYYPVEMSEVLSYIKRERGTRFAIVGLPCFIKAVELAKIRSPRLKKQIVVTLGLICGQTKSKRYTEYIINDLGSSPETVKSVCYRKKVPGFPSTNYAFEMRTKSGEILQKMWSDTLGKIWVNDFFKQKSCNHCDDVFAECADIAFMDAWLPEYSEYKGTSLIVNRSPILKLFFESQYYSTISHTKVIQSQLPVLKSKRAYRTILDKHALKKRNVVPRKRVFSTHYPLSKNDIRQIKKRLTFQELSREASFEKIRKALCSLEKKSFKQLKREFLGKLGIKKYEK